ncbi:MAG: DUF805 domain-containing protein [Betaproteobacteria bacterium]|nr:DUF805 domain-containing protein [Betaproteobacteria bacterium]
MHWYLAALRKYAVFDGRATRSEFWHFMLVSAFLFVSLLTFDVMAGSFSARFGVGILGIAYALFALLPALAVTVRRLHDTDRSGRAALVGLLPGVGPLVLLAFVAQRGQHTANRFGPDPRAPDTASADTDVAISVR